MKIVFAKHIGFCSGVKRAIRIAQDSLEKDPDPVQFLGEIIHNEKVIEKMKRSGGKFISNPRMAKTGTLIIQAHGFPPFSIRPSKKILLKDATCPLVKKAQAIAQALYKDGYKVVIFGDKDHAEVRGINGYINNKALVISDEEAAKKLGNIEKIGFLAQTTQNEERFKEIIDILKEKSKDFKWVNTLCPEVTARQRELNQIFKACDGILVIGSKSSANTRRLYEKAKKNRKKVWWVNSIRELKIKKIKNILRLGVVSGTSTPDWEIEKIQKWLKKRPR